MMFDVRKQVRLMPPLGKSQPDGARKPFNLADHSYGEQVDAVRLKIASLMDGVTENEREQQAATDGGESGTAVNRSEAEGYEQSYPDQSRPPQHQNGVPSEHESGHKGEESDKPESHTSFTTPNPVTTPNPPPAFAVNKGDNDDSPADRAADQAEHSQSTASAAPEEANAGLQNDEQTGEKAWYTGNGYDDELHDWPRQPKQTSATPVSERNFHPDWNQADRSSTDTTEHSGRAVHAHPPLFRETEAGELGTGGSSEGEAGNSRRRDEATTNTPAASQNGDPSRLNAAAYAATNSIHIKGRAGGILIEIGKGEWPVLMMALTDRLAGAANFFRNGNAALDLAERTLVERDLAQLHELLKEQSLELVLLRTSSQETFQTALDMGLSAQLETAEGDTTATAQPALSNLLEEQHFVYTGHLRAGQVLQRREHILILGDVNPGATVISDGDILVWGHLRGVAHAGASSGQGIICALNLAPVQLRIGDFIAIAPEPEKPKRVWGRQQPVIKQPELAYLAGDRINVEPWDATKFGGIAAFRRHK